MEQFIPTEDQLFDYFLGEIEDQLLETKIGSYLKTHPKVAEEFNDWTLLEKEFQRTPQFEPSTQAVQNVMREAKKQIAPKKSFWNWFQNPNSTKRLALTFSMILTVGVTFTLARVLIPADNANTHMAHNVEKENINTGHLASAQNPDTINKVNNMDQDLEAWATTQFEAAKKDFQDQNYKLVNKDLSQIINKYPNFSKRQDLYKYWIESLKKTGQFEVAAQKKEILDRISNE